VAHKKGEGYASALQGLLHRLDHSVPLYFFAERGAYFGILLSLNHLGPVRVGVRCGYIPRLLFE
jgi:hypothetical protein